MLKAGLSVILLITAAFCVSVVIISNRDVSDSKEGILALQKSRDGLEARLHHDLQINGARMRASSRPASPNSKRMMEEAFVEMGKDNKMLRHEVEDLQQQSMIMAQVLKSYSKRQHATSAHAPNAPKRKIQRLAAIDTPNARNWYGENHPGGGTLKTNLNGIQENPLDSIDSADPIRDPYDPDRQYIPFSNLCEYANEYF